MGNWIGDENFGDLHEASQNIRPRADVKTAPAALPDDYLAGFWESCRVPSLAATASLPRKLLPHLDVRPWCRNVKWSYRIATLAGIQVRIHLTFLLLLGFYAWVYYTEGGLPAAASGVTFTLLIFLCVLLHEFGHAFAAKAFGIRTPDITLLPIGGVARLERMPANPWQELVIAIAGPAVNVFIAVVVFLLIGGVLPVARIRPHRDGKRKLSWPSSFS